MAAVDLWSYENPTFSLYVLCSVILLFKTLIMAPLTGVKRFKHKSFANAEDMRDDPKAEVKPSHPAVERVRRAHQNDLENIIPFLIIALLYVSTNPSLFLAKLYFVIFTIARLVHTVVYLNEVPQPARSLAFMVGLFINIAMLISIFIHAKQYIL